MAGGREKEEGELAYLKCQLSDVKGQEQLAVEKVVSSTAVKLTRFLMQFQHFMNIICPNPNFILFHVMYSSTHLHIHLVSYTILCIVVEYQ